MIRHFALDRESMTTTLGGNVTVPLKPFLGIMGVAPADDGPRSTVEPDRSGAIWTCLNWWSAPV